MAKSTSALDYRAKPTVSSSAIFKRSNTDKLINEGCRQEQAGHQRLAGDKKVKIEKETGRIKSQSMPEHSLAKAFSGMQRCSDS